MLLPWHVTMIPRFLLLRELGLYNTLGALIVPTFLGDAFSIFLLRQFFLTIPEELSEAARLDGCSEWGIFWRIMLPLARPALATVALFQFIASWNDFNGPLLYLNDPGAVSAGLWAGAVRQLVLQPDEPADGRGRAVHAADRDLVLLRRSARSSAASPRRA